MDKARQGQARNNTGATWCVCIFWLLMLNRLKRGDLSLMFVHFKRGPTIASNQRQYVLLYSIHPMMAQVKMLLKEENDQNIINARLDPFLENMYL